MKNGVFDFSAFNLDENHIDIDVCEYIKLELDAKGISWEEFIKTTI
ncbi:hypothetical protein [Mycoplasmopsis pullorum]|nr:hypothetical protein [Mycoplasmopsis pullorum]